VHFAVQVNDLDSLDKLKPSLDDLRVTGIRKALLAQRESVCAREGTRLRRLLIRKQTIKIGI
jgi:hypothetical protein